jgi:aminopeptidase
MNYNKLAKTIVRTNLDLKEKDAVVIIAGPDSLDYAEAIAYECSMVGAQPSIQYGSDKLSLKIYKDIKPQFLKIKPKISVITSKLIDVKIIIAKKLPQDKIEIRRKALKPIEKILQNRTLTRKMKIALVGFPTKELAKALGISFKRINKIYFDTMTVDYKKLYKFNTKLAKKFHKTDKIRIIGERTDLEFSIKNRKPLLDSGIVTKEKLWYMNIPSGEVFFAPVENSANGEIYFDLPCMWHYGKHVKGVWFKFKNGRVIDYEIEKGLKNFEDVMKNASGQKDRIAELGIGTNPRAKFTGGMTIIDEKIKGTIHIAIGKNKHFGGNNESTIHWDFFKNMRKGKMFVDGKLIMKNGKLLV